MGVWRSTVGGEEEASDESIEHAARIYQTVNPNWLVSLSSDDEHVILDGGGF